MSNNKVITARNGNPKMTPSQLQVEESRLRRRAQWYSCYWDIEKSWRDHNVTQNSAIQICVVQDITQLFKF